MIVAFVTDLFFSTKIHSTAKVLQIDLKLARTLAAVEAHLKQSESEVNTVIVDLNADAAAPVEAIRALKLQTPVPQVIAFLSHVQVELAEAARLAGADLVLPRSAFSAQLPELLKKAAAHEEPRPG